MAMEMVYSSQKAQRVLGWTYRPAKQIWDEVIEGEIALLERRKGQNLLARLKPLEGLGN